MWMEGGNTIDECLFITLTTSSFSNGVKLLLSAIQEWAQMLIERNINRDVYH